MANLASALPLLPLRKPPARQLNWITGELDTPPEQLDLPLPPSDDAILPADESVLLLATENGSQLLVSGFGLFIGKKSERVVVKKGKAVCAQVPFLRIQEIIVASRGVSLSSDIIEELCSRGIRVAFLTGAGKPFALLTSPLLTATVETRRAQLAAYFTDRGADLSRWIVAGKLRNQEKLLRYFARSRDGARHDAICTAAARLKQIRRKALETPGHSADATRGQLLGYEGAAGRLY